MATTRMLEALGGSRDPPRQAKSIAQMSVNKSFDMLDTRSGYQIKKALVLCIIVVLGMSDKVGDHLYLLW